MKRVSVMTVRPVPGSTRSFGRRGGSSANYSSAAAPSSSLPSFDDIISQNIVPVASQRQHEWISTGARPKPVKKTKQKSDKPAKVKKQRKFKQVTEVVEVDEEVTEEGLPKSKKKFSTILLTILIWASVVLVVVLALYWLYLQGIFHHLGPVGYWLDEVARWFNRLRGIQ